MTSLKPVKERRLRFAAPALRDHDWYSYAIAGEAPGPRLCVMAGMHVNEVAGIAAARQLIQHFRSHSFRGEVEILPVTDPAAVPSRAQHCNPVDGRNINFSFPGDPQGSYSPALADALLNHWAGDADLLIDLHGGDLCEVVAPFAVLQESDDPALDAANLGIAEAFDPEIVVRLARTDAASAGRSCSGRAWQGRRAGFFEAGGNGLLDTCSIAQHVDGVLRSAARIGMIATAPALLRPRPLQARSYHWVSAPCAGWCDYLIEPGALVDAGACLAEIRSMHDGVLARLTAPAAGLVLWRGTHPLLRQDEALFGIAGDLVVTP